MIRGYMLIGGEKVYKEKEIKIRFPYDLSVVGTIPEGDEKDVERAVETAKVGLEKMKSLTPYDRYALLNKTARLISSKSKEFAELLTLETGKTIKEAMSEVARAVNTITFSAEEAKRLHGEEVLFTSAPGVRGKVGFYKRVPVGIVGCITPFNFPLNLTCHKVAPALAGGNSVVIKPSENTSLVAIKLVEVLLEAGFPPESVNLVTGYGETVGDALVRNENVRMITFTGSVETGKTIMKRGGFKKYAMELGSNSAVYVCEDQKENLDSIAEKVVRGAFALAGQVCISVQRVFVDRGIFEEFVNKVVEKTKNLRVGDPRLEETDVGPVIDENSADRIVEWIEEAVSLGAKVLCGGKRLGKTLIEPTVLANVPRESKLFRKEVFGPVFFVNPVDSFEEAVELINDSRYGLQSGIFTKDINKALKFSELVDCGGIMVNEIPTFRVDHMPYGGMKESGFGREGPRFAIEEMTEIKLVCIDLNL